jgi:hypothetical protein
MSSHAINRACCHASAPDPAYVLVPTVVVSRTNLKVLELNASPCIFVLALFSSRPDLAYVSALVFTVILAKSMRRTSV